MTFERRRTAPEKDNEFYYSNKNIFYACGYGMPNCTAYAHGRYMEICGEDSKCRGNAGNWLSEAKSRGRKTSSSPALGSIAVWKIPGTKDSGHVAVVEGILPNGDIITSNSAYKGTLWYEQIFKKSDGYNWISSITGKKYEFQGFILPPKTVSKKPSSLNKIPQAPLPSPKSILDKLFRYVR